MIKLSSKLHYHATAHSQVVGNLVDTNASWAVAGIPQGIDPIRWLPTVYDFDLIRDMIAARFRTEYVRRRATGLWLCRPHRPLSSGLPRATSCTSNVGEADSCSKRACFIETDQVGGETPNRSGHFETRKCTRSRLNALRIVALRNLVR